MSACSKNTKRNWVAPSCFIRDAPVVTRRQCYIFFLQYPSLGSIKIAITFKFSVSHITLRTTKLSPLTQQARTEENYRYDKQDVNMNSFVRLNFWNLFHFSQFSFLLIHLSNFRAQWIIFLRFVSLLFRFEPLNFSTTSFSFVILQSIIWKSSSFYSLVCRIFLLIHDSTSLLSFTFFKLQCILHGPLAKPWRNQEVEIESCPDYPRALSFSNDVSVLLLILSDSKTKYASCMCNRRAPVMWAHCCLAFRRVNCRFSRKHIIYG